MVEFSEIVNFKIYQIASFSNGSAFSLRWFFMRLKYSLILLITILALVPAKVNAQKTNQQMWFEYMLNYSFANSFNLENAFTYSTILNNEKWRALDYAATLEYSLNQHFDFQAGVLLSYTTQKESYNTFEFRPMFGTRIFFTPNRRIQTRLLLREEMRNFKNLETNTWETVWRPRARFESLIPINKKSYYENDMWYGILDAELLFVNNDVSERFANRFRLRTGIGYRLNYAFRFEFVYMLQQSKDEIDGGFESSDNVFRFRLKHYLRKSKPVKIEGNGG